MFKSIMFDASKNEKILKNTGSDSKFNVENAFNKVRVECEATSD